MHFCPSILWLEPSSAPGRRSAHWPARMPFDVHDDTEFHRDAGDIKREGLLLHVMREIDGEFATEDLTAAVVREPAGRLGYRVMPGRSG